MVVGLAQAQQLKAAPTRSSVAAKTLRRDNPQSDEQSQYHELLDHGAIVTGSKAAQVHPVSAGTRCKSASTSRGNSCMKLGDRACQLGAVALLASEQAVKR